MTTLEIVTLLTAIIAAACGLLGAVLGIINTCYLVSRNRLRLRVRPMFMAMSGGQGTAIVRHEGIPFPPGTGSCLSIEVLNLSSFPVTVCEVGLQGATVKTERMIVFPGSTLGDQLPKRLEPRVSMLVIGPAETSLCANASRLGRSVKAYAKTSCGCIVRGTSPALKQYVHERMNRTRKEGAE
jgi:hypothetical protein